MEETKQLDLSSKVYKLVVAVIVLVALFYAGNLFYNFQTLPQNYPQEISISGEGKVFAKPDVAVVVPVVVGVEAFRIEVANVDVVAIRVDTHCHLSSISLEIEIYCS